jgi:hypothetical protein
MYAFYNVQCSTSLKYIQFFRVIKLERGGEFNCHLNYPRCTCGELLAKGLSPKLVGANTSHTSIKKNIYIREEGKHQAPHSPIVGYKRAHKMEEISPSIVTSPPCV